jgi:hypothetical protein
MKHIRVFPKNFVKGLSEFEKLCTCYQLLCACQIFVSCALPTFGCSLRKWIANRELCHEANNEKG